MIYLQVGILILEIGLCMLLNNLLKNKFNKKIRYAICIALLLNCWNMRTYRTYIILFTCITSIIQKKKTNHLHTSFSYPIHIHRNFWLCEYVYNPSNHIQRHNYKRNHKYIIKSKTKFLPTWQRLRG